MANRFFVGRTKDNAVSERQCGFEAVFLFQLPFFIKTEFVQIEFDRLQLDNELN